ncbi:MAG: hypothetical protein WB005_09165, partial [Pseudolabrys sp.]
SGLLISGVIFDGQEKGNFSFADFYGAGLEVHQISNGKGTHWAVADERDFSGRHHGTGHRIRNRLIMERTI